MPKLRRIKFEFDERSLMSPEQLEARGIPLHEAMQGRVCLTTQPAAPAPQAGDLRSLAALGYATLASQIVGHTPLPFAELPTRVRAGWMAAARAMRQQVLEGITHGA